MKFSLLDDNFNLDMVNSIFYAYSFDRAGVMTFPHNAKLQYNFGNVLRSNGLLNDSVIHYREAIRYFMDYIFVAVTLRIIEKYIHIPLKTLEQFILIYSLFRYNFR